MIELSFNCEISDVKNLWNIILSQSLNLIISLREMLRNALNLLKILEEKLQNDQKILSFHINELTKNLYLALKINYLNNLTEITITELALILHFPIYFCEITYNMFTGISQNFKNFPSMFFTLLDESISQTNLLSKEEMNMRIVNIIINVKRIIQLEAGNNLKEKLLFDSNLFSIKSMKIKIDSLCKVN